MFDFDTGKLLVIGVVALIVIGPKELPRVLRQVGQAIAKLRRMAGEFQGQFMDAMKEAELDDLRKEAAKFADSTKLDIDFNPAETFRKEISGALDGKTDEAVRASLVDDPDGAHPAAQMSLPNIEPPAPLILPEPIDPPAPPIVAAADPVETAHSVEKPPVSPAHTGEA